VDYQGRADLLCMGDVMNESSTQSHEIRRYDLYNFDDKAVLHANEWHLVYTAHDVDALALRHREEVARLRERLDQCGEAYGRDVTSLAKERNAALTEAEALRARVEALEDALRAWLPKCGYCGGSGRELTWDMKGGPPTRKCTDFLCKQSRALLNATKGDKP
jgi:hypothetical protein